MAWVQMRDTGYEFSGVVMARENGHGEVQRTGRIMMILAWVAGLVLLTVVFEDQLAARFNPNASPDVVTDEHGVQQVVLERNAQGHYVAGGFINGVPVTFLLDTGATHVAVSETLADRLRLEKLAGGISQTANGAVAVWRTRLDEVRLGVLSLRDVPASILPSMSASEPVLLGMSFLKQVDFSQSDGRLVLTGLR
jgi:aspartyl protease family protein